MEKVTDWIRLWQELSEAQVKSWKKDDAAETEQDAWRTKAREFHACVSRRWGKPDSSRDLVVSQLDATPDATILDIGAGTGAWAILLARHARKVTAVDPSPAMIEVMKENLEAESITNVEIIHGSWPDVQVGPHDFSLCSHAMYGYADLPAFIRRMIQVTRHACFLVMRAPTTDGIMAEAAMHIWGHPHDSLNFQVAYNVLMQMGICANVLMENSGLWDPWTSATLEEALDEVKRRFGLGQVSEYDDFLTGLLRRRLTLVEGQYVWPRGVRSALVYWDVSR